MAVANQLYHMARARKWEQCLSALGTMRNRCTAFDIVNFNICIHACRHHWEHALSCFRHARQQRLQPTVRTFGSLCAALGVGHRWVQVLALLQHVPCTWDNTDVLTNVVLGVFKKAHRWDLALELCAGWKIAKTIDSVGMMELVSACSKSFRWQEALALACQNQEPKLQVYNWLLYGFRGGACWQAGIALLDHAASRHVAANAISHRHLMFLLDGAPWQQAVQLLQDSCGWSQRWREADAETIVLATATMECQHRPVENLHIFGQIVYCKLHMRPENGSAAFTSKGAHNITILHDSWMKAGLTSLLEPAWCRHFLSPVSASLRLKRFVQPSAMRRLSHTTLENAHVVPGFVARLVTEVNSLRGASRWRTTWWMQAQLALRPLFVESRVLRRADAGTVRAWIGYDLKLPESTVSMRDELTFEASIVKGSYEFDMQELAATARGSGDVRAWTSPLIAAAWSAGLWRAHQGTSGCMESAASETAVLAALAQMSDFLPAWEYLAEMKAGSLETNAIGLGRLISCLEHDHTNESASLQREVNLFHDLRGPGGLQPAALTTAACRVAVETGQAADALKLVRNLARGRQPGPWHRVWIACGGEVE
ncbi:unnamed protein product [Symbiodinium sp. CCMP2456]|nr:unnamed protein product [Symbiodinium sp. CCMP2456]